MPKRKGGSRRKTRGKYSRPADAKGKLSIRNYLAVYSVGDKALIKVDPISTEGIIHARFYGKIGTITGKKGRCYEVEIKDMNKTKNILVHPVHLRRC